MIHPCKSNKNKDVVKNLKKNERKKCKYWHFLKKQFFSILIISLVILDLQGSTIPQIKAKDISFGPYSSSFLAKINILWERKWQSCLIFFYPDLTSKYKNHSKSLESHFAISFKVTLKSQNSIFTTHHIGIYFKVTYSKLTNITIKVTLQSFWKPSYNKV